MRVVRKETAAPWAGRSAWRGGETQVPVPYVFITVSSRRPRVTHFSNDRFIADTSQYIRRLVEFLLGTFHRELSVDSVTLFYRRKFMLFIMRSSAAENRKITGPFLFV